MEQVPNPGVGRRGDHVAHEAEQRGEGPELEAIWLAQTIDWTLSSRSSAGNNTLLLSASN